MSRPSLRRLLVLAVLVLSGVSLLWMRAIRPFEKPPSRGHSPPPSSSPVSPLATQLNAPDATVHHDLRVVHDLLGQLTTALPVALLPPLGDNEDVTAALTGRNRRHLVFMAPDSPLIDASGRLLDRWGSPYFFHARSAQVIDVRSAGPDRQLFTADDVTNF